MAQNVAVTSATRVVVDERVDGSRTVDVTRASWEGDLDASWEVRAGAAWESWRPDAWGLDVTGATGVRTCALAAVPRAGGVVAGGVRAAT